MLGAESEESPPVPTEDHGGDERLGWWVTGVLCVAVGWAGAVAANLLVHRWAPSAGWQIGPVWVGPTMGPFAWAVLGIGAATGAFGVVLFHLARRSPKGRFVLPGYPY